mmetsp:Transcript_23916/g.73182  ORF Transcript_23916/g.73182 Transcript_23916/m.73182 type:complete len:86 (-) Transcript_23916:367-624(-)
MQILKDKRDLSRVELCRNYVKTSSVTEVSKEFPSDDILKHHIQVPLILKCASEMHNKWVLALIENCFLRNDMLHLHACITDMNSR